MFDITDARCNHTARLFTVDLNIKYSNYRYVLPRYVGRNISSYICKAFKLNGWHLRNSLEKNDLKSVIVTVAAKYGAILSLPCQKEVTL